MCVHTYESRWRHWSRQMSWENTFYHQVESIDTFNLSSWKELSLIHPLMYDGLLLCQPLVYDGTFPMSTSCAETFTGLQRTRICILADSCHCSEWHLAASWWAYIFLTFLYIHPYTSLYILTHSYTFIHIHSFASYFCQGLAPTAVWYHNPHKEPITLYTKGNLIIDPQLCFYIYLLWCKIQERISRTIQPKEKAPL